jgi:phage head maturation protease
MLLELLTRSAAVEPTSFNEAERSVRVTWSTGAAVDRRDGQGPFREVLSLDPTHVDLSQLRGASVLDTHQQRDLRNVLGVVTAAGLEGGTGWATIRFSGRPEVAPIVEDVRAGIIRHVSVGYSVRSWRETIDRPSGTRTRTAVSWTPKEISFVPLPADPGASVRSSPVTTVTQTTETETRAEVNRAIRTVATAAGLGTTFADALIDRGATVEEARAASFEELVRRGGGTIQTQRATIGDSGDDPAVRMSRMQDALVCRLMPSQAPSDAARPFMNLGLVDMAREALQLRGERVGMISREEIITRAMHTTSDFPNLLSGTGNRVLAAAYEAAPNPLKLLARKALLPDFRPKSTLKLSDLPKLKPVTESGEIKGATRSEAVDAYSLGTFGEIFNLSRKAIINDDLGAFADWAVAMGRAAAETEADQLVQLLIQGSGLGPVMGDTKRLFHSDHGNLAGSGAAPGTNTLAAGRLAMRTQTGVDGTTPINATAKYILIPPSLETTVDQLIAAIYAATVADVNPFSGRLTPLVEPRLTGNAWYLFADPAVLPVLEYAYLSSAPGPQIASREGWNVLGMEFRVVLDFGCGAVDHRGAYRNPGA